MVACCRGCGKALLVTVNFVFIILGLAMGALGVFALVRTSELEDESELLDALPIRKIAIAVISVGVLLTSLAVCGCVGALKETHKLLVTYATVLTVLILLQIAAGVYIATQRDTVIGDVREEWRKDSEFDKVVAYQDWLGCCGFEGVPDDRPCRDRLTNGTCPVDDRAVSSCRDPAADNCLKATEEWIDDNITPIGIALAAIAALQLVGLTVACLFVCNRKRKDTRDDFYNDY